MERNEASDEAVSPIIATILMVAIGVVLAAVLFVFVQQIGQGSGRNEPSGLLVSYDKLNGRFQVTKINSNTAHWSNFEIRLSVDGDLNLNAAPSGALDLQANQFSLVAGGTTGRPDAVIQPGDLLALCVNNGPKNDVAISIRELSPNTLIYESSLVEIPDCP